MRRRNAFTFVELIVVVGLFVLVAGAVWATTSVAHKQGRQLEGFSTGAQAAMLARALLGRDLEHLVVQPGRAAAQVGPSGAWLRFPVADAPGARPESVKTARVTWHLAPAPRGGFYLCRNGHPITEVPFARGAFATNAAATRHDVSARLELTLDGGGAAMTGRTAVILVERSYGLPETYSGLRTFLAGR